jgi:hypothetical protein
LFLRLFLFCPMCMSLCVCVCRQCAAHIPVQCHPGDCAGHTYTSLAAAGESRRGTGPWPDLTSHVAAHQRRASQAAHGSCVCYCSVCDERPGPALHGNIDVARVEEP